VSDKEMPCKGFRRRPQRRSKKMRECAKEEVVDSHYDASMGGVFYVKEEEEFLHAHQPCEDENTNNSRNVARKQIKELAEEDDNRLIFQEGPFRSKLAEIVKKSGIKNVTEGVHLEERRRTFA